MAISWTLSADLPTAADYYLEGLKNWNQALIYSIEKIHHNTGLELIGRWEQWLKEAENANKLKILQIGSSDWSKELAIPDNMAWYYFFPNSNLAIKRSWRWIRLASLMRFW